MRKSWPLTPTQWQFVEQLKEQEKNELKSKTIIRRIESNPFDVVFNRQPSPAVKGDGTAGGAAGGTGASAKRAGQASATATTAAAKGKGATAGAAAGKGGSTTSGRPGTGKGGSEKTIDTSKPHWVLRVVSDADKAVGDLLIDLREAN